MNEFDRGVIKMSFIIAVYVDEGIVIASDRRVTYNLTMKEKGNNTTTVLCGIHTNNSTSKSFVCPNGAAIATCGEASVNNKPIAGFISAMIREKISIETKVEEMPNIVLDYFNQLSVVPDTSFLIAGYDTVDGIRRPLVFNVNVKRKSKEVIDTKSQGATWSGEIGVLTRLLQNGSIIENGNRIDLQPAEILWQYFTLQDAIDFARYAVETTIKTMHFYNVVETVGGSVDILVITPNETRWLQKEELH